MFTHYTENKPDWLKKLENAFINYFGEERVDIVKSTNPIADDVSIDCPYLVVYFPFVHIIRYEYGGGSSRSHDITDLFMFIGIDMGRHSIYNGLSGLRTTYTVKELRSSYSHSHLTATRRNNCHQMHHFCTGSGPIVSTISNIATSDIVNIDEEILTMLAFQLDLLVSVESQEGIPYISITNISNRGIKRKHIGIHIQYESDLDYIKGFVKYLADKNFFTFVKTGNKLFPSKNLLTSIRDLSKEYIDWLVDSGLSDDEISYRIDKDFIECKVDGNEIVELNSSSVDLGYGGVPEGTVIIKMHDTEYPLRIVNDSHRNNRELKCLSIEIINDIYSYIFFKLNFSYGSKELQAIKEERI